jgi:hypothetical protein
MPWSVRAAAAALAVVLAVQGALLAFLASQGQPAWAQNLVAVGAVALLLTGLLRRWRLAWLWGRFLGFFLAALLCASAYGAWRGGSAATLLAIPLLGLAAPLLAMSLALGRPSALAWFGLTCPACGAVGAAPADLRFRRARCRRCRAVW